MAMGTCLRGFGCSTFPHTHAHLLASPIRTRAGHGWHGMAWFGRVCLCLIMCVSFCGPCPTYPSNILCTHVLDV